MKSQKGQSLVETALILPVLLLLVFGITDFGRIFHVYLTLDHAGREAARIASIGKTDQEILDRIEESTSTLDQTELTESITPDETARSGGDKVTITLTYPVEFLTPIISQVIGEFNLQNKTVMRVE